MLNIVTCSDIQQSSTHLIIHNRTVCYDTLQLDVACIQPALCAASFISVSLNVHLGFCTLDTLVVFVTLAKLPEKVSEFYSSRRMATLTENL